MYCASYSENLNCKGNGMKFPGFFTLKAKIKSLNAPENAGKDGTTTLAHLLSETNGLWNKI